MPVLSSCSTAHLRARGGHTPVRQQTRFEVVGWLRAWRPDLSKKTPAPAVLSAAGYLSHGSVPMSFNLLLYYPRPCG